MEFNLKSPNKPTYLWSSHLGQGCQDYSVGERRVFSANGAGATGYPHIQSG